MTTFAPTVVAYGDLRQVSLTVWRGSILSVLKRAGNDVIIHREGAAPEDLEVLPFPGTKNKLTAAAVGDLLHLTWDTGQGVFYARYDLGLKQVVQPPQQVWLGTNPSIQVFKQVNLVINSVNLAAGHEYRVSRDGGMSWTEAFPVHPTETVVDVDSHVSPLDDNAVIWEETANG